MTNRYTKYTEWAEDVGDQQVRVENIGANGEDDRHVVLTANLGEGIPCVHPLTADESLSLGVALIRAANFIEFRDSGARVSGQRYTE
ncbi:MULTISPECIES: hypothetical protein [Pandoraea]|uniref:hypothetical protein n=1 Tax=Pandoraea TaxID=93217 RepID=UPI001F5D99E4|nr:MULTISPECIES: hypothetical protein [Pandoraea]MCI3206543.1 hypothetical protein [Pandoraea sp. LA3]MDN4584571.1 hypothetical protein [Pandoraea capi]